MQIYHYHPVTGEYVGPGMADESPLEKGVWLVPANATALEPPIAREGHLVKFEAGSWEYAEIVTPEPAPEPEQSRIPTSITPRQAKLALLSAGLLDDVDAAIEAIPDAATKRVAQIEWEYAQDVRRDWPMLNQVAAQMGMTDAQIDELFIMAAAL